DLLGALVHGDDHHRHLRGVHRFGEGGGIAGTGVPDGGAWHDRAGCRTGTAAREPAQRRSVGGQSVDGGGCGGQGREPCCGGGQSRTGGRLVDGCDLGVGGRAGAGAHQIEERAHTGEAGPVLVGATEFELVGGQARIGADGGGGAEGIEGEGQAAGHGQNQLFITLSPVLDQGDV